MAKSGKSKGQMKNQKIMGGRGSSSFKDRALNAFQRFKSGKITQDEYNNNKDVQKYDEYLKNEQRKANMINEQRQRAENNTYEIRTQEYINMIQNSGKEITKQFCRSDNV